MTKLRYVLKGVKKGPAMRMWPILIVGLSGLLALGGCAGPRAVGMYVSSQTELPMYPGGRQVKLEVQPSVVAIAPGWIREVVVPQGVEETRVWYDKMIREKGWKDYTGHTCQDGTVGKDYRRSGCGTYESLSLEVRPDESGSRVRLDMYGNYWWDFPSKLPFLPFYWTLGDSDKAGAVAKLMGWL